LLAALADEAAAQAGSAPDLGRFFEGYQGCFVLLDLASHQYLRYNPTRSALRLAPWSTFKIPNSLINLELGNVRDASQVTKWDGVVRDRPEWNRDQTLASAFSVSAVWYYQRLARETGERRMHDYLHLVRYGNEDISGGIDRFWLGSSLRISADEQVDFLRRMLESQLPFSSRTVAIVKEIMIVAQSPEGAVLRGKTGTGGSDSSRLNWFVGYVEREGHDYVFATNIEGPNISDPKTARRITESILRELKFF
jgi:beta-lactamase class D